ICGRPGGVARELAVALPRQSAARGVRGVAPGAAAEGGEASAGRARGGPAGARAVRGGRAQFALLANLGRSPIRMELGAEPGAPRDGRRGARALVAAGAEASGAVPAGGAPGRAHGTALGGGRRALRVVPFRGGVLSS